MDLNDLQMLDWREEEKLYCQSKVNNYLKEQATMPLGFLISYKTLTKNCEKIREEARQIYRDMKLMTYEALVYEERKRIDKLVEDINNKFESWLRENSLFLNGNQRPFKLTTYSDDNPLEICQTEFVKIGIQEPFTIGFMQQRMNHKGNEIIDKINGE